MARDLTPIVKRSRREKVALHPKAIKGMTTKPYGPGQHGASSMRSKPSQYAIQMREKQKVKRMYGLLEKPFARLINEALRQGGVAGENLLAMLERRLDNAVYRLGLAPSRQGARQLVTHGHFMLNGRRVDIPSIRLKPGDTFEIRAKSQANTYFVTALGSLKQNPTSVGWLSFDHKKSTATVTGLPTRDDAEAGIDEQLIIEYYSR
jgi:small subunit ribosomal protein S4